MSKSRKIYFLQFLGHLQVLVIFIACLLPLKVPQEISISFFDKWVHLIIYGWLALWFAPLSKHKNFLLLALIFMGIGIEFLQSLTSYRTGDILDIAANSLGAFLGMALAKKRITPLRFIIPEDLHH